jgi:hypothetical protein
MQRVSEGDVASILLQGVSSQDLEERAQTRVPEDLSGGGCGEHGGGNRGDNIRLSCNSRRDSGREI